jgi:threonine 3-dehydrogenase
VSLPEPSTREACCLITGGAGNLARGLAHALAPDYGRLVLTDLAAAPSFPLPENAAYEKSDITDFAHLEKIIQRHRPQAIVHLASLLSGSSEADRRQTWHVNTRATLEIMEQALVLPGCRVLFASTLATYGGELPETVTDEQQQWPTTLYGVTKVAGERLGAYYRAAHGLDFRCVRLPIVISRQAPPAAVSAMVSRAFIESAEQSRFTFRAAPKMRVVALHVDDAIAGLAALLLAPREALRHPVYNLSGFSATLGAISEAITQRNPAVEHRFEPDPAAEDVLGHWPGRLDDSAARRDWGWKPRFDLAATVEDFLGKAS